jgi:streptogramin lyase
MAQARQIGSLGTGLSLRVPESRSRFKAVRKHWLLGTLVGLALVATSCGDSSAVQVRADKAANPPIGQPVATAVIHLDPGITDVAAGYGAVWATLPNAVVRIDPNTNKVVATIPVQAIEDYGKLAVGEGGVWVTHQVSKLSRIDPASNQVIATIDVGPGVRGVTTGGGMVWVTREPGADEVYGSLVAVDAATNTVVGSPHPVGIGPGPVTYGAESVWVTNTSSSGSLMKLDSSTGQRTATIDGVRGSAVVANGRVWAATTQSVMEIDPITPTVVGTIPLARAWEVEQGLGAVWVLTLAGTLSTQIYTPDPNRLATVAALDPVTGTLLASPVSIGASPSYMAVGEGAVWVAQYDNGTITRVDPSS